MPLDLRISEIFPISDFVRNASAHTARIRETNRAEILMAEAAIRTIRIGEMPMMGAMAMRSGRTAVIFVCEDMRDLFLEDLS